MERSRRKGQVDKQKAEEIQCYKDRKVENNKLVDSRRKHGLGEKITFEYLLCRVIEEGHCYYTVYES